MGLKATSGWFAICETSSGRIAGGVCRATGDVESGTFILVSAIGAARGRVESVSGTSSFGIVDCGDGRAAGVTVSVTLILDSARGAASGREGPAIGIFSGAA